LNNNNNNNNVLDVTPSGFIGKSEFSPWFFGSLGCYFSDKKFTFIDVLKR
jgi:hypothetical protein